MDGNTFQHANLWAHVHAVKHNETEYMKELTTNVDCLTPAVKGTCFAALHLTRKHKALNSTVKYWDIASLYKMLTYLDTPRQVKQLAKKIEKIESQHPHLLQLNEEEQADATKESGSKRKTEAKDAEGKENDGPPAKKKRRRKIDGLRIKLKKLKTDLEGSLPTSSDNEKAVDSSVSELIKSASVSGSLARKIRTLWAPTLKADYLEFVMLEMPKKTVWRYVADLVHFKPKDFSVSYFLADIFDEAIPEDSFVFVMRKLMEAQSDEELVNSFREMAASFPQIYKSYAFLRNKDRLVRSKEIVELLAENIPVETAIWYFEELYKVSKAVPSILERRLAEDDFLLTARRNESKVFTFGKLLERLLTFQKFHQKKLASLLMGVASVKLGLLKEKYRDNLNPKAVAVFGDASSSMTTAIEAAAIIASIISTTLDGELSFFTDVFLPSPVVKPSSVEDTLEVCQKIHAHGCTSLAACMWPYYEAKKFVDTIVMVTDEEENTECHGYYFAELLAKYREEVNPNVVLVIVRVGQGDMAFQKSLERNKIEPKVVMIDNSRPDLTKFDGLVGQIAAASQAPPAEKSEGDTEGSTDEEGFVMVDT